MQTGERDPKLAHRFNIAAVALKDTGEISESGEDESVDRLSTSTLCCLRD